MTITSSQRYQKGDLVHVDKVLPCYMSHFIADVDAIVIGSYEDLCGGVASNEPTIYSLHLENEGEVAWYEEKQLTLLATCRTDLLEKWKAVVEAAREAAEKQREAAKPPPEDICQVCKEKGPTCGIVFYWWRMQVCVECENLARKNGHIGP